MTTALRVLTSITDYRHPNPADLEELARYMPSLAGASPDELACSVIQQALKQRTRRRAAGGY